MPSDTELWSWPHVISNKCSTMSQGRMKRPAQFVFMWGYKKMQCFIGMNFIYILKKRHCGTVAVMLHQKQNVHFNHPFHDSVFTWHLRNSQCDRSWITSLEQPTERDCYSDFSTVFTPYSYDWRTRVRVRHRNKKHWRRLFPECVPAWQVFS